jgi:putative IMPACT (imprinted ancient) family translation regulator
VDSRDAAKVGLKTLKRAKSYAKATRNTWAAVLSDGQILKNDDGEAGAGMVIVRMLQRQQLEDHMIVVTRWFGGTHLGGDRFRHVQSCVRQYIAALEV